MEIVSFTDYESYKNQFDQCMKATANNFVKIGYLLKQARDTDILKGSGYSGMGEFAKEQYGLDETKTSRFIAICERFGNGADRLIPEYEPFGYAKLSEMLLLPENISEVISPEMTREEIREIKQEVREEQAISPVEVMLEAQSEENVQSADEKSETIVTIVIKEYLRHNPAEFKKLCELYSKGTPADYQEIADILAPQGMAMLIQRIPGRGKYMIKISGTKDPVTFIDVREESNRELEWKDFSECIVSIFELPFGKAEEEYQRLYDAELIIEVPEEVKKPERIKTEKKAEKKEDKKSKIAPAQKKEEPATSQAAEPVNAETKESDQKEVEIVKEPQKTEEEPVATSQQTETVDPDIPEDQTVKVESSWSIQRMKVIVSRYDSMLGEVEQIKQRLEDRNWNEAKSLAEILIKKLGRMMEEDPEELKEALDSVFDD